MAVTSQLTSLEDFEGTLTFVSDNTRYGGGQAASENTDIFIEGAQSGGRRADNVTGNFGFGLTITSTDLTGQHVKFWVFVTQWAQVTLVAPLLASGTGTTDYDRHTFPSAEYPSLGGFVPIWVDVDRTAETAGAGFSPTAVNEVGCHINIGDVGGNAQNFIVDEIMYGTSGLTWDGTGGDFADFTSFEDTNNEGNVVELNGVVFVYSRLEIGSATATTFTDSGYTLIFPDQGLIASDFMGISIDLQNASTDINLNSGTIASANPSAATRRPDFIVTGNSGALDLDGVSLLGMRTVDLTSGVTIVNSALNLLNLTQNSADISDSSITVNTASQVAACDDPSFANLDNVTWIQGGSGHAIEITSTGTHTLDAQFFQGFGANGSNDAAIFNNSGGAVTLSIINGGDTPTYRNGAGASTTVSNDVNLSVKVIDESGANIQNAQVAIFTDPGGTQLMNEDTLATGLAEETYNYVSDQAVIVRVRKSSTGATRYYPNSSNQTITSTGLTLTVTLIEDNIASA